MDKRVGGTEKAARWVVTGFSEADRCDYGAPQVAVQLYLGDQSYYVPLGFGPAMARAMGQHMIEMADHAEGVDMPGADK